MQNQSMPRISDLSRPPDLSLGALLGPAATRLMISWAIALCGIWTIAAICGQVGKPQVAVTLPRSPVDVLSNWDGNHYRYLAKHGYSAVEEKNPRLNLFPLFVAVSYVLGGSNHAAIAGILLNQLLLLGSMLLLTGFSDDGRTAPLREQPGFWLLISPFAFFFWTMYTESLFLFLSLVMTLAVHRRFYAVAFTAGILAGLTRPTAIFLPLLLVFDLLKSANRHERFGILTVMTAPLLGILLYVGAVGVATRDPLGYLVVHAKWGNEWMIPFYPMYDALFWYWVNSLAVGDLEPTEIPIAVASTAFVVLLLLLYGWHKPVVKYLPYLLISILSIHAQYPFRSTARYELVLFPVFLLAAQSFLAKRWLFPFVAIASIAEQLYLFVRFTDFKWVA
jgi:hypothetical protein